MLLRRESNGGELEGQTYVSNQSTTPASRSHFYPLVSRRSSEHVGRSAALVIQSWSPIPGAGCWCRHINVLKSYRDCLLSCAVLLPKCATPYLPSLLVGLSQQSQAINPSLARYPPRAVLSQIVPALLQPAKRLRSCVAEQLSISRFRTTKTRKETTVWVSSSRICPGYS